MEKRLEPIPERSAHVPRLRVILQYAKGMSMEAKAKALGWDQRYAGNPDFRARFDEMYAAVEQLPPHLIERGRSYDYPQLHRACVDGDIELLEGLLSAGLSADAYLYTDDEDDEPPLVWLAQDQDMDPKLNVQVATLLLAKGADVDEGDPLLAAKDADDKEFADFLRASGAVELE